MKPKLDGIRVIVKDGVVYSRSLKAIPNKHVQTLFRHLNGLDGELIVGNPTAHDVFQKTTSGVMSKEGEPDVTLYAFDMWNQTGKTYESRYNILLEVIYQQPHVYDVPYSTINTHKELLAYADIQISAGYEGIMLRNPNTTYKYGRATNNTQELLKYKLFEDSEFECVGIEELMHNENELKTDELGYAERSSCKDGLKPSGMLGALILKWIHHHRHHPQLQWILHHHRHHPRWILHPHHPQWILHHRHHPQLQWILHHRHHPQ